MQCVLLTDGSITFAILLYDDSLSMRDDSLWARFDAGDGTRRIVLLPSGAHLPMKNIFRIDG